MKSCACLAEGYSTRAAGAGAHSSRRREPSGQRRRSARLTALTPGGTIPDNATTRFILEPQAQFVGTVNEDFAVESCRGMSSSWACVLTASCRVEQGRIASEDFARGERPPIPFWLGRGARADG